MGRFSIILFSLAIFTHTFASTIEISTPEDLKMVRQNLTASFKLTADIDLSEESNFTPLSGAWGSGFIGVFDGNGFTISGMRIVSQEETVGLFGRIGSSGVVKNLTIENSYVEGTQRIGLIAGRNLGRIENCYVSGEVKATDLIAGGAAGLVGEGGSVHRVISTATVTVTNYTAGGVVGWLHNGQVTESAFFGSVRSDDRSGGIVGGAGDNTLVEKSFSVGSVRASKSAGGIVGWMYSTNEGGARIKESWAASSIFGDITGGLCGTGNNITTNSFWDKEISGMTSSVGGGEALKTVEMLDRNAYSGWDFQNVWTMVDGLAFPRLKWMDFPEVTVTYSAESGGEVFGELKQRFDPLTVGSEVFAESFDGYSFIRWSDSLRESKRRDLGFSTDTTISAHFAKPMPIHSFDELVSIGSDSSMPMDYNYYLVNSLDGGGTTISPLGDGAVFHGSLDGRWNTISNVNIEGVSSRTALFSTLSEGTSVHHLHLENFNVSGGGEVAVLAGRNLGSIKHLSVKNSTVESTGNISGGLVGVNIGSVEDSRVSFTSVKNLDMVAGGFAGYLLGGTISRSSAVDVKVSATHHSAGFVGYINGGAIDACFAKGDITVYEWVSGGFAGIAMNGKITNSYARSSVSTSVDTVKAMGGFVGFTDKMDIVNSYSASTVVGGDETRLGGFIGDSRNTKVTSSYWDVDVSDITFSGDGEFLWGEEMAEKTSFRGWDFSTVWKLDPEVGYPQLMWIDIDSEVSIIDVDRVVSKDGLGAMTIDRVGGVVLSLPAGTTGELRLYRVDGREVFRTSVLDPTKAVKLPPLASGHIIAQFRSSTINLTRAFILN